MDDINIIDQNSNVPMVHNRISYESSHLYHMYSKYITI